MYVPVHLIGRAYIWYLSWISLYGASQLAGSWWSPGIQESWPLSCLSCGIIRLSLLFQISLFSWSKWQLWDVEIPLDGNGSGWRRVVTLHSLHLPFALLYIHFLSLSAITRTVYFRMINPSLMLFLSRQYLWVYLGSVLIKR